MVRARVYWRALRNFAIAFSVIFNLIFLAVIIVLVLLIFDIKNTLVNDLVLGLDKAFYGLKKSDIIASVLVDDVVPVKLNIPYSANTIVKLTSAVPIRANTTFNLPGGGGTINGSVNIVLPVGLELPVALSLNVPVDDTLRVKLTVPVNIKIQDTQLNVAVDELRNVLRRYVLILDNLPSSWGEFWPFLARAGTGGVNLLAEKTPTRDPWPGFPQAYFTPKPGTATPPGFIPTLAPAAFATLSAPTLTFITASPVGANFNGSTASNVVAVTLTPLANPPTATRVQDLGILPPK